MKHLSVLLLPSSRLNLVRQLSAATKSASKDVHASRKTSEEQHVYRTLYPWRSKSEFVRDLAGSIFYYQDGLIALSKPYGVPLTLNFRKEGMSQGMLKRRLHISGLGESPYSLEDACEGLAVHLNVDQIFVVKPAERYASGVTILASDEQAARNVHKALLRAKPMKIPYITAWIIAKGYPVQSVVQEKVAMKLIPVGDTEKHVEVLREFSKTAVKGRVVKTAFVKCKTLSKNTDIAMSLLQVSSSNVRNSFLRAYVASLASCIVGDLSPNACLTKHHQGRPLVLSPSAAAAARPQPLLDEVCKRLKILNNQQQIVPTMVHYQSLLLPCYHGKDQHLLLSDPTLPSHFSWTLDRLQLQPNSQLEK